MKIFLPLINTKNQVQEEIIAVTNIFLKIFMYFRSTDILNQEFIMHAGHALNSLSLFPGLTNNLIKIVKSLENEDLRRKFLKLLMMNESIESISIGEKAAHLNSLLPFIINLFVCDRENFYVLYNHIRGIKIESIESTLNHFIPEVLNDKSIDAICIVIAEMIKDKSYAELEVLLKIISIRIQNLTDYSEIEAALLYIISDKENFLQKKCIEILLKDIEKLSDKKTAENSFELEKFSNILCSINENLDVKIDHSVALYIFEIFSIESLPTSIKILLIDIITNRISYSATYDDLLFYISLIEQHMSSLVFYLNSSSYFPH